MGNKIGKSNKQAIDFDAEVTLYHFRLLRSIGRGTFGKVSVVQHRQTEKTYALKYINKSKCVSMKAVGNVVRERRMLEEIEHPYVVNMYYAFQDDYNCFYVLDLMLGGDLRFHLHHSPSTLPPSYLPLMTLQLLSALQYLHFERHIVHRDIKPDNILLDAHGNAHLTDFNVAARWTEGEKMRGVAGSLCYMAPELLKRKGYSHQVDYFSLGVTVYEVLFGRRPFRSRGLSKDVPPSEEHWHIRWPKSGGSVSKEAKKVVAGLLERNPKRRLGPWHTVDHLPWFDGIDRAALSSKTARPSFAPSAKRANFDPTYELEELLLSDNPLRATKRDPKRDITKLSHEMRVLEERFTPYDSRLMGRAAEAQAGDEDGLPEPVRELGTQPENSEEEDTRPNTPLACEGVVYPPSRTPSPSPSEPPDPEPPAPELIVGVVEGKRSLTLDAEDVRRLGELKGAFGIGMRSRISGSG